MSWLLPPVTDPLALVAHEVLAEVLVGSTGSPLRKALIDSGLGEDLSPVTGFETDLREGIFAVGLRGTDPSREAEIQKLILDTLARLATEGLDDSLVQSMVTRTEFRNREIRGSGGPYALRLMGRTLRGWAHGMDPVDSLVFSPAMEQLKARLAEKDRYLESLIRAELLDSPHRVTLVVRPDPGQEKREAGEAKALLSRLEAGLSGGEREHILAEADRFRRFQLAPDSPEAAATLPTLRRTDLKREIERIPCEERQEAGGVPRLLLHDIFTNGIVYLDACVPLADLTERQSLLLPFFAKAVCGCGLPGRSYSEVSLDLFRLTGGFSAVLDAGGIAGRPGAHARHLVFRTRCLQDSLGQAVDLVANLLGRADFRDLARIRDLVLEHRNSLKAALVPSGHLFASLRAGSMISASVAVEEQWKGVTQLAFVQDISADIDTVLSSLAGELEAIRAAVLRSGNLIVNATAPGECFSAIASAAMDLASRLPGREAAGAQAPASKGQDLVSVRGESLSTTSAVGFAAQAIPGFRYEDPRSGLAAVLGHLLTTGYLWEKVRMEGGAYGVFAYPRNLDGLFLFGSYRDPKIGPSLKAYRESLRAAGRGGLDEAEVEQALIGTIGNEDRPLDPAKRDFASLQRNLHGLTDGMRQARRDALLAVNAASLAEAASQLLAGWDRGACAAIAGKEALAEAARDVPELAGRVSALPE